MLRYFHNISFRTLAKTTTFVSLGSAAAYYFHDLHRHQREAPAGYDRLTNNTKLSLAAADPETSKMSVTIQNRVKTPFQVSPMWTFSIALRNFRWNQKFCFSFVKSS